MNDLHERISTLLQQVADEEHIRVDRIDVEWLDVTTTTGKPRFRLRFVDIASRGGGAP